MIQDQVLEMFKWLTQMMDKFQKQLKVSDSKKEECFYALTKLHVDLDKEFQRNTNTKIPSEIAEYQLPTECKAVDIGCFHDLM